VADRKFAMVHCPQSQEKINAIILICVALTLRWIGLQGFFEQETPRKGVKKQIL